jgi:hypothetical protein
MKKWPVGGTIADRPLYTPHQTFTMKRKPEK